MTNLLMMDFRVVNQDCMLALNCAFWLKGEMGEQQGLLQDLASQLELVTTDVKGLGR